jgi:hypothetical protein
VSRDPDRRRLRPDPKLLTGVLGRAVGRFTRSPFRLTADPDAALGRLPDDGCGAQRPPSQPSLTASLSPRSTPRDAMFLWQEFLAYLGIFEGRQPLAFLALFGTRPLPTACQPILDRSNSELGFGTVNGSRAVPDISRRTMRASAPNATDPVTLSIGDRPSEPFVKCVIPRSAASSFAAISTSGCKPRRVSEFLWESAAVADTMGSMMMPACCLKNCDRGKKSSFSTLGNWAAAPGTSIRSAFRFEEEDRLRDRHHAAAGKTLKDTKQKKRVEIPGGSAEH